MGEGILDVGLDVDVSVDENITGEKRISDCE